MWYFQPMIGCGIFWSGKTIYRGRVMTLFEAAWKRHAAAGLFKIDLYEMQRRTLPFINIGSLFQR